MKLRSQSMLYLSVTILAIVTIWAALFYWSVNRAIKRSLDEGLENYKRLIIEKATTDSTFLENGYFDESFFTIQLLKESPIKNIPDSYIDTMLLMQDKNDVTLELEPVRMLITRFYINGKYYELKVANSIVEKEDLIRTILLNTIGLYIILISGIIFINNIILKRLWTPFYNLLNQLKDYKFGTTKNYPIIKTKTQEFIDLQKATNILLKDNKPILS